MHLFELLFTEANQQMLAHQVGKRTHTGMKEEIIYSSMAANKADRIWRSAKLHSLCATVLPAQ